MNREGTLVFNDCGRWEFEDIELTCGALVEICIDGRWIRGLVEFHGDRYYWFSRRDSVPVVLCAGIKARILTR